MIIYLTVVGLLLFVIGLTGFLLSFGLLERIICGSAALVGVILCVGASRVRLMRQFLLESTLVVWGGEFGRTPTINAEEFLISLLSAQVLRRPKSLAYLQSLKWVAQVKEKVR